MVDEFLVRQVGAVAIAARQPQPCHAQFALCAFGHFIQRIVENIGRHPRHRLADGDVPARHHVAAHAGDRAFGRAIAVDQPPPAPPQLGYVGRQGLAADIEQPDVGQGLRRVGAATGTQEGGRRAEDRRAGGAQPVDHIGAEPGGGVVHHHQRRTAGQCQPAFLDRGIVSGGRALNHPVAGAKAEFVEVTGDEVGDRAMLDHHALGLAGGATGVDHIGQPVGRNIGRQLRHRWGGIEQRGGVAQQRRGQRQRCQQCEAGFVGQHRHRFGILDNLADPLGRESRVDAGKRRAGLQHRQLGDRQQRGGARQAQREDRLAIDACCKVAGQVVAGRVQLGVGQRLRLGAALASGDFQRR